MKVSLWTACGFAILIAFVVVGIDLIGEAPKACTPLTLWRHLETVAFMAIYGGLFYVGGRKDAKD